MFEERKARKALSGFSAKEDAQKNKAIKILTEIGPKCFPVIVEGIKYRTLLYKDGLRILRTLYTKDLLELYIGYMGDSKDEVRFCFKEAILTEARDKAVPQLIDQLQSENFFIRKSCVDLLSKLGDARIARKIVPLVKSENQDIKKTAMDLLCNLGGPEATDAMLDLLQDKDWWIRKRAVEGISKLKDPITLEPLLQIVRYEKDPQILKSAVDTIGKIGDRRCARDLLKLLNEEDMVLRQMAMDALINIGDASLVQDLVGMLVSDDVNVRRSVVEILNNIKDPAAGAALVQSLKDRDWWVREIATDALTEMRGENLAKMTLILLDDPEENVRRSAVEFFNRVHFPEAYGKLVSLLNDPDWWVREKALTAVGKMKRPESIGAILDLMNDGEVKWAVPQALGEIGGKEVVSPLLELLGDASRSVRLEALKALEQVNDPETIPYVKGMVKDEDEDIRKRTLEVLKTMTGRSYKIQDILEEEREGDRTIAMPIFHVGKLKEGTVLSESYLVLDLCNSTMIGDRYGDQFALELKRKLTSIVDPIAKIHRIQFSKSTGDGYLMTYPTNEMAAEFALEVLREMGRYNRSTDDKHRIDLRFAINFGESRVDPQGDRLGTAVNMTFRVEGVKGKDLIQTEGGLSPQEVPEENRIFVTEPVYEELKGKDPYRFQLVGFFDLKGIAGRHRVFWLTGANQPKGT
jgi:HEAT repeat protein/class 3 adenylate cyclase